MLLYGLAALQAMDVFLNWTPDLADARQLRREHAADIASLLARGSVISLAVAVVLGLVGIAAAWHPVVPGAMCGTGVLQAMGPYGRRAMLFWGLGLIVLHAWQVLDRMNRSDPEGPATRTAARMLIAAAPLLVLAVHSSWLALMHADAVPAVSCCAAVYDRILAGPAEKTAAVRFSVLAFWGHLIGGVALLGLAIRESRTPGRVPGAGMAGLAFLWAVAAAVAVKQVWSASYYQVLSHPCPWCLFLPEYHGAGFIIFGCGAVIVMEAAAIWSADSLFRRYPQLAQAASRRLRSSARRIIWALIGFAMTAAGPAIFWRLHTGAWIKALF